MDPFILELFVIPIITIGLGVLGWFLSKKLYVAPLVTLILAVGYDIFYFEYYYHKFGLTSWDIILPIISLLIAFVLSLSAKTKNTNSVAK